MASDKQQYEAAISKWDRLQTERAFSLAPPLGSMAIICSGDSRTSVRSIDTDIPEEIVEEDIFRQEAVAIASQVMSTGRRVNIAYDACVEDLQESISDPSVSDIVVIGHGNLSAIGLMGEAGNGYDWVRVAEDTTHLKQGLFVQRQCGHHSRTLSVPLGLFAVNDHRKVIAAAGHFIDPDSLEHPDNNLLQPVSDVPRLDYQEIKKRFPRHRFSWDASRASIERSVQYLLQQIFPTEPSSTS